MLFGTYSKVSILDVLCQPVLGFVSNLSWKRKVGRLELRLEVVVLEVVAVAVVALDLAELSLLVVKVHPQLGLAECVLLCIGRVLCRFSDAVKENLDKWWDKNMPKLKINETLCSSSILL